MHSVSADKENGNNNILVTGMSGTGKTAWLLYMMWLLAKADKTVVLPRDESTYYVMNR